MGLHNIYINTKHPASLKGSSKQYKGIIAKYLISYLSQTIRAPIVEHLKVIIILDNGRI